MADEEKAKAEKLLAAKKRVDALKKKNKKAGAKKEDKPEASEAPAEVQKNDEASESAGPATPQEIPVEEEKQPDSEPVDAEVEAEPVSEIQKPTSISVQSKMRSASFKQSTSPLSPGLFSAEENTAPEIYRKQAAKIEELEKENKRLAKDAADGEKRWKKAEEELDDLREADGDATKQKEVSQSGLSSDEVEKLRTEIVALQRQNTQLQAQANRGTKHGTSPSVSQGGDPASLEADLRSKSSTIESMEIEISNLRAQMERVASGSSVEKEQIAALEDKLARSEKAADIAQQELGDLKKNLDRTTEKAVKEGSERTSAETKLRSLEREAAEYKALNEELQKKVDALEKKVATLTTLHKEQDARSQAQKKEKEKAEKDTSELRSRVAGIENENLRLREERDRAKKLHAQGVDDEGVDELENEERQRLEKKVRDLESEVHELRRGVWRERRVELDPGMDSGSPGTRFSDVDLGGSPRNGSIAQGGKGIGGFITSGFNAITGGGTTGGAPAEEGLLDEDELLDFDEDAYRLAQEEEAKKRIERIKETKRGFKNWETWRLDLVESRMGGGEGFGPIFEV